MLFVVTAFTLLSACGSGSAAGGVSIMPSVSCSANQSINPNPAGGTLTFPSISGASGTLTYSAQSSIPAGTTIAVSTLTCFSSIPASTGINAKTQLAFTLSANQQVQFAAANISVVLPSNTTATGPYGFQIFDGYNATSWSEELATTLSGEVISMNGSAGLTFVTGHTYIVEVVQNPDISDLPSPAYALSSLDNSTQRMNEAR